MYARVFCSLARRDATICRCTTLERPLDGFVCGSEPFMFFGCEVGDVSSALEDSLKRRARDSTKPSRTRNSPALTFNTNLLVEAIRYECVVEVDELEEVSQ
jgi:hypothetical protein